MYETPLTGLVLSGGGARAAYQVGVLRALMALRREHAAPGVDLRRNPFGVIVGTSAGAVNAAALACHAETFEAAVEGVAEVWAGFRAEQVYRADSLGVLRTGARWLTMLSLGWLLARWHRVRPNSLFDNTPLAALLQHMVPLERLPRLLRTRQLQALAVTASSYTSGEHFTCFQAATPLEPWQRTQRLAVPAQLTHQHLLASSAIPFLFPATLLQLDGRSGWFGDGSMRQTAPLSPAIHLGAQRLLVIGAGRMQEPPVPARDPGGHPSLAQIAGHALASIFLDALALDVERLQRINRTLALLPEQARTATPLRPIEALVIAPSQRLDDIAARHVESLPPAVRTALGAAGVRASRNPDPAAARARGAALASYLLFEAPYTRELMALGEADTRARRDEVLAFFGWHLPPAQRRSAAGLGEADAGDAALPDAGALSPFGTAA